VTVRDNEVVELLRDEPELLAIADAVAATQDAPRRAPARARRLAPRLVAVAAAVAAVIAVVLLAPDRVGHRSVIERALAAIGNGRVLHLRTLTPSGTVFVDLRTGRRTVEKFENEFWYDRDTKRFHVLMRVRGHVADFVWPDDAKAGMTLEGAADSAFTALWSGYREALANGTAKLEREGRVDGHPVYWLRFRWVRAGLPGTEVAIDSDTYKPIVFREYVSRTRHVDERVLLAETTDFRAEDFKRLGGDLFGGSSSSGGSSMDLPAPKHPSVHAPWLTPGKDAAGLPLAAVNPYTATANGRTVHGVELVYGRLGKPGQPIGLAPLTIVELPRPEDPDFWKYVPRGSVAIQQGESGDGRRTQTRWTGYVVTRRMYVTIETSRGEQAVVSVARALRPAR
jgi:hypothetical protein